MFRYRTIATLMLFIAYVSSPLRASEAKRPPNFVVIMADDKCELPDETGHKDAKHVRKHASMLHS